MELHFHKINSFCHQLISYLLLSKVQQHRALVYSGMRKYETLKECVQHWKQNQRSGSANASSYAISVIIWEIDNTQWFQWSQLGVELTNCGETKMPRIQNSLDRQAHSKAWVHKETAATACLVWYVISKSHFPPGVQEAAIAPHCKMSNQEHIIKFALQTCTTSVVSISVTCWCSTQWYWTPPIMVC